MNFSLRALLFFRFPLVVSLLSLGQDTQWRTPDRIVDPLSNLLLTGEPRSTGFVAKSLLAAPGADAVAVVRVALVRAASLGARLFGVAVPAADGVGLYAYESEANALAALDAGGRVASRGRSGRHPGKCREHTEIGTLCNAHRPVFPAARRGAFAAGR